MYSGLKTFVFIGILKILFLVVLLIGRESSLHDLCIKPLRIYVLKTNNNNFVINQIDGIYKKKCTTESKKWDEKEVSERVIVIERQTKKDWRAEKPLSISLVDDGDSELIER